MLISKKCSRITKPWGYGSVGRASRSQCEGQGFESPYLHQTRLMTCFFIGDNGICAIKIALATKLQNPWQARADAYAITEAAVGLFLRIPLSPPLATQVEHRLGFSFVSKWLLAHTFGVKRKQVLSSTVQVVRKPPAGMGCDSNVAIPLFQRFSSKKAHHTVRFYF